MHRTAYYNSKIPPDYQLEALPQTLGQRRKGDEKDGK